MTRTVLLFILCLTVFPGYSRNALDDFKQFSIHDKKLGTVNFCVTKRGIDKRKPLLVLLDGSGDKPLFRYKIDAHDKGSRMLYLSFPIDYYDSLAAKYHVVLISKPAIPVVDSFLVPSLGSSIESLPVAMYNQLLSAEWRAGAASLVINTLTKTLPVDDKKIAVAGYSEGSQVAPRVAAINKQVTHVICFCGNGINQFYDFIIAERMRAATGEITEQEAQNNIDTLMAVFKDIYAHPKATDRFWADHTYQRWASFCAKDPLDYLLQLSIPVYLAHGTADANTQVLSTDYVALEFLRKGKTNITYKPYPGYDHFFQKAAGQQPEQHLDEVVYEALQWLEKN